MKPSLLLFLFLFYGQISFSQIDKNATIETKSLFKYLKKTSKKHILFGHQHATEYGHGWAGDSTRSDVKSVVGTHPAVIGVDLSGFYGLAEPTIEQNKEKLSKNVAETYNRGGITTVAWHFSNPASKGGFYWKDSVSVAAMALIKPGGTHHEKYKEILKGIGNWANSVKGNDDQLVPMIFRPFHEFDGGWFWWGKPHCSRENFIDVWQFTVSYLRDSMQVHNFIYAFSPDNKFTTEAEFLERYPGNDFVDMVGMDNYGDFGRGGKYNLPAAVIKLKIIDNFARKNNKLAALTETGLEGLPDKTWWTESLLKSLKSKKMKLSYVLVWRNDSNSKTHFYVPYPGHPNVQNFIDFYKHKYTYFERDLRNVYGKNAKIHNSF